MPVIAGFGGPGSTQSAALIEYGNTSFTNVNSAEVITNASCTNPTAGSIIINTAGGIAPYTYTWSEVNVSRQDYKVIISETVSFGH